MAAIQVVLYIIEKGLNCLSIKKTLQSFMQGAPFLVFPGHKTVLVGHCLLYFILHFKPEILQIHLENHHNEAFSTGLSIVQPAISILVCL